MEKSQGNARLSLSFRTRLCFHLTSITIITLLTTISSLLSNWRSLQLLYGWVYGAMQWAEKWSSVSLTKRQTCTLLYTYDDKTTKKRPAEKLFSVSLTFVNATKKIKGIPLWVCTLMSLAAVSIYHSLYYCVASCQRNCQLTLFCSPFERRNK